MPVRSHPRVRHHGLLVGGVCVILLAVLGFQLASGQTPDPATPAGSLAPAPELVIMSASVRYLPDLDVLVFEQTVEGVAGASTPAPVGDFDGAPVLGHVFPTTLPSSAVGFGDVDGIVALAVTSHPDFDDTPLWDENRDGDYENDGQTWHAHWVVLGPDDRVPGGLAVLEASAAVGSVLPPTNAPVPLYLDSPGFPVGLEGNTLRAVVPAPLLADETMFSYDAATVLMRVNTSDEGRPTLGVYDVYGVLSGDLGLPYTVDTE